MTDLPEAVIEGLKKYYEHRKAHNDSYYRGDDPCIPWDKEDDTDVIFTAAKVDMWSSERMAGHFWFKKRIGDGGITVEIDEDTLSAGGKKTETAKFRDGFEVEAMLTDVFARQGKAPFFIDVSDPNVDERIDEFGRLAAENVDERIDEFGRLAAENVEDVKRVAITKGISDILKPGDRDG